MKKIRKMKWLIGTAALTGLGTVLALSDSSRFLIDPLVNFIVKQRSATTGNFTVPREPERRITNTDGSRLWSNLSYPSAFPNHFFDLYSPAPKAGVAVPTVIYVHGGGFIWGDKADGDPFAQSPSSLPFVQRISEQMGYNVVSINYAFAPQYRYPTPVQQLNEAIAFLQREQQHLGLDMTQVILSGGSAGAHITSQYALMVTNAAYAKEVGIMPALSKKDLKALYLQSPALDVANLGITDDWLTNLLFDLLGPAYFGSRHLARNPMAKQANVLTHLTPSFPPTFMSDGNTKTLDQTTRALADRLKMLGVVYEYYSLPKSVAHLGHGFELGDTIYAQEALSKAKVFLKQQVALRSS